MKTVGESPALTDTDWYLLVPLSAILMCSIVLSCSICIWYKKQSSRKKGLCENILINLGAPTSFTVRSRSEPKRLDSILKETTESSRPFAIITTTSETECENIPEIDQNSDSIILDDAFSLPMTDFTQMPQMKRSQSLTVLPSAISEEPEIKIRAEICFNSSRKRLNIKLLSVSGLSQRQLIENIYCKINLFPCSDQTFCSEYLQSNTNDSFLDSYTFEDVTTQDLEKSTLRFTILSRKRLTSTKEICIGEQFLSCSDYKIADNAPFSVSLTVMKRRSKRLSTSDKHLMDELGNLFLLLQYQRYANRMKILIRKAKDLPKSDRLVRQPEHYIRINLQHGSKTVSTRETRLQKGYYPVWNQPFLFDIPSAHVNSYSLEFILMRGKLYTKDGVLGHVIIGPDAPQSGQSHWQEVVHPYGREVTKWHNILPRFQF